MNPHLTLGPCADCGSEHLRPGCGLTFAQRLRTTQIHGSATPTRAKQNYYCDEGLTEIFGADRKEREAQMADATQGRGFTTTEDLNQAIAADE